MNYKVLLTMSVIIFITATTMNSILAWDDCPYGLKNDPYPGRCHRYIDTNNNQICDHSEPEPIAVASDKDKTEKIDNPAIKTQSSKEGMVGIYETQELSSKNKIIFIALVLPLSLIYGYVFITKLVHRSSKS